MMSSWKPPAVLSSTGRRRLLFGTAAAMAATAGATFAWRNSRFQNPAPTTQADLLWSKTYETSGDVPLQLDTLRGRPLLLNFWATWCPPCVEELPLLDVFFKENTGKRWQVLGLAIDQPQAVRKFLARAPVSFPVALAQADGIELSKAMGNLGGGLPFTVVFGADGGIRQRKIGRVTPADLLLWVTQP